MAEWNIGICDDENIDLVEILNLVKEYDQSGCFHTFTYFSAAELLMSAAPLDIALLDIEMTEPTGFEAAKELISRKNPPVILFITKSNAYALKGYGIALRYIQKPIDKFCFFEAMDAAVMEVTAHRMAFKINGITYALHLVDIFYIEIYGHYAMIHSRQEVYKLRASVKDIITALPQGYFVRTHKSFIVNMEQIRSATSEDVTLCDGTRIPLSRGRAKEFNDVFNRFLGR